MPRRVSVPGKEVVLVITPEGLFNAVKDFDPATRDIIYTDVATGRIVKRKAITFTVTKASGIQSLQPSSPDARQRDAWYTLDGRRLTGQPTAKGLYIHRPATGQTRITLVQ